MAKPATDLSTVDVRHHDGVLTLVDANTTIGYCHYDAVERAIEYLFVHPAHRRRGHALRMLEMVVARTGGPLSFHSPLSPMGAALVRAWRAQSPRNQTPPYN